MTITIKKSRQYILTFLVSFITLSTLSLGNPLSVTFAQNKQNASSGIVTIKITNTSNTAIKVLKWNTPLEKTLSANIFHIQNGKNIIPFTGRLVKRMSPRTEDYTIFEAGEQRIVDIALPTYYKMTTKGSYEITYNATFKLKSSHQKNAIKKSLKVLNKHIRIDFTPSQKKNTLAQKQPANFNSCSQDQINILNTAHDNAISLSQNAYDTLTASPANTWGERYNTWFGVADNSRQNTVTSHFNKIHSALDTENIVFDCSCTESHIAHVYPSQPYTVYLCTPYWDLNPTGTDSHAGTLVHEVSHFTVVADTNDHAYGHSDAKALATSNPALAVANADSHEYFAENTPFLSMDDPFESAQQINDIVANLPISESIDAAGDKDIFKFTVTKTGTYTFNTTDSLDTQGTLYDESRTVLEYNDDVNASNNEYTFKLSHFLIKNKTYYIKVNAYSSDVGGYTLNSIFKASVKNDFNGNGIADILWRKENTNHVWMMQEDGSHSYVNIGTKSATFTVSGTGDLNGDGITDILWRKGHSNYIWYMNEDGSHTYKKLVSKSYNVIAIKDFNADGIADILWRKDNQNHIWYMNEDGTYIYQNIGTKSIDYTISCTGDLNGDGITDILWRKGHKNYIWYMNADGTHTYKKIVSKSYTVMTVADFNNDGIADILWRLDNLNNIWYMNTDGTYTYKNIGTKSNTYTIAKTADYNGDGTTDILWRKGSSTYLWYMHADGSHTYKKISDKSSLYTIQ